MSDDKVTIRDIVCIHATPDAILVVRGKDYDLDHNLIPLRAKIWVPQSLVDDDSEVWKKGDKGKLVIPEWFASKKGLE